MGEASDGMKLPGDRTSKPKPQKGTLCPWLREAALLSGRPVIVKQMLCDPLCAKFGLYYPDGRMEKALGCRRGQG